MQFGQKVFSGPMPLAITVSHITVNLHNRLAAARTIYKLQSRLIRRSSSSSCSSRAGADFILNLAVATGARLPLPPPPSSPALLQLVANAQSFWGQNAAKSIGQSQFKVRRPSCFALFSSPINGDAQTKSA